MRLINTKTYHLEEFHDEHQVKYAILSHRWEDQEVLFKDMTTGVDQDHIPNRTGWYKIQKTCEQAAKDGLHYAWVDTCCIDKSSSAELQEAINSMFRWYAKAEVCYAYLSDISRPVRWFPKIFGPASSMAQDLVNSQWFKRGWTLQELLAPTQVVFFDADWTCLGDRFTHADVISEKSHIPAQILRCGFPEPAGRPCIADLMSWASGRRTTRPEDRAYSLLGLFDVHLPLLYGEGEKAFTRLQEEILRYTDDQSIFAWNSTIEPMSPGLLAKSPDVFEPQVPASRRFSSPSHFPRRRPHAITNEGISLEVVLYPISPKAL